MMVRYRMGIKEDDLLFILVFGGSFVFSLVEIGLLFNFFIIG